MNVLAETLKRMQIGEGRSFSGLTVFPLLDGDARGAAGRERGYRTLDEALSAGTVRITEVGEAGHVPELRVENQGDRPVLLLDGEELVGAKQNRVLNLTVLAPAGKTIVIPVSCVEAGRWRYESDDFCAMPHVMLQDARLAKARAVSASMHLAGTPLSDQGAVWASIAGSARRYGSPSPTGAMREIYNKHRSSLDRYVAAFPPEADQLGAVFAVEDAVRGVEAFDHTSTLASLLPKVVRSWALEVVDRPIVAHGVPDVADARAFLDAVAEAGLREHAGVGLGTDLRFDDPRITGGALVHAGVVVHLCAFGPQAGRPAGDVPTPQRERTFDLGRMLWPRRRRRA